MLKRFTAVTLVLTTTWISTWAAAPGLAQQSPPADPATAEAFRQFDRYLGLIEELRSHIERSQFDMEALLEELQYDPNRIISFVGEQIRFEPYSGLLRGAQGTLLSRGGNALDQSVLLATLLKDTGLEARIARSQISPDQAIDLIRQPFSGRRDTRVFVDPEAAESVASRISDLIGQPASSRFGTDEAIRESAEAVKELEKQIDEETQFILQTLETKGIPIGGPNLDAKIVEETTNYFFVEYRDQASEPWRRAHPTASDPGMFADERAVEYFADEIPASLQHRFRLSVIVEQELGKKTLQHVVFPEWERPVANLVGRTLTFSNASSSSQTVGDAFEPIPEQLRQGIFIPTFGGLPAVGGLAFDHRGFALPIDVLQMDSAGALQLFKSVSEKTGSAVDALSSLGSSQPPSPAARLSAIRMEYAIIAPGGEESHHTRYLVDRRSRENSSRPTNPTDPDDVNWLLNVTDLVDIVVAVGEYPEAYLIDRSLRRIVESAGIIRTIQEHRNTVLTELPIQLLSGLSKLDRGQDAVWAALTKPVIGQDSITYRSRPNVMAMRTGFRTTGKTQQGFVETDILANERRALPGTAPEAPGTVGRQLWYGVRDTHMEQILAGGQLGGPDGVRVTAAFRQAREAGHQAVVLGPGQSSSVAKLNISEGLRFDIQTDLEQGNFVILPAPEWPFDSELAWWKIDAATGTVVGVGEQGKGIAATEYVIALIIVAAMVAVLAAGVTYTTCMDQPQGDVHCCVLDAVMYGSIGFGASLVGIFSGAGYGVFMALIGNPGQWLASGMGWTPTWCCMGAAIGGVPPGLPGPTVIVPYPGYCSE